MQFFNDFNLLALLLLGLASQVLNVTSQSPTFKCVIDTDRPFGFCRRATALNAAHSAARYALIRANAFRNVGIATFNFNCEGLSFYGEPADNSVCCDQDFGLKIGDQHTVHYISVEDYDQHCSVVAT